MNKNIIIILFLTILFNPFNSFAQEKTNQNNIEEISSNFIAKLPFKIQLEKYFLKSENFRKNQLFMFLSEKDLTQNEIFIFEERINNQTLEQNKKEIRNSLIYLKYYALVLLAFILGNIFVYYILILVILFYLIYKIWKRFKS